MLSIESEESNIELPIILSGDYKSPNLFNAIMSINLIFMTVETEIVNIGDKTYVKDPITGLWRVETSIETGFVNPSDFINLKISDLRNLIFTGTESLDGVDSYLVKGNTTQNAFGLGSDNFDVAFWIDVDNSLIGKIQIEGDIRLTKNGPLGVIGMEGNAELMLVMELSDYNKTVTITTPTLPTSTPAVAHTPKPISRN